MQLLWKWAAHSLKICASNQFWQDEILKGGLQYVLLCDNHLKSWLVTRVPDFIFVQTLWYGGQRGWKWREIWIFLWKGIALYLKPLSKLNEKYFFFIDLFSIIHKILCSKWSGLAFTELLCGASVFTANEMKNSQEYFISTFQYNC